MDPRLRFAIARTGIWSESALWSNLTHAERRLAELQPTARRRLQFVLGRIAAHRAVRLVLGPGLESASVEVVAGPGGVPQVEVSGSTREISVSIAHSGGIAAALAWLTQPGYRAGVDIERIRDAGIGEEGFVFSQAELDLLARMPEGRMVGAIAAWTVKEAVWKALWPDQDVSPLEIEIAALSLSTGKASVGPGHTRPDELMAGHGFGGDAIWMFLTTIEHEDERYICSVAEILAVNKDGISGKPVNSDFGTSPTGAG